MSSDEKEPIAVFIILIIAFIIFYFGILYVASFERKTIPTNVEKQNLEETKKI